MSTNPSDIEKYLNLFKKFAENNPQLINSLNNQNFLSSIGIFSSSFNNESFNFQSLENNIPAYPNAINNNNNEEINSNNNNNNNNDEIQKLKAIFELKSPIQLLNELITKLKLPLIEYSYESDNEYKKKCVAKIGTRFVSEGYNDKVKKAKSK